MFIVGKKMKFFWSEHYFSPIMFIVGIFLKVFWSENCFGLKENLVGLSFWLVTCIGQKIKTLFKISKPYDSPFWEIFF